MLLQRNPKLGVSLGLSPALALTLCAAATLYTYIYKAVGFALLLGRREKTFLVTAYAITPCVSGRRSAPTTPCSQKG
jgi:hypothetical protein